MAFIMDRATMSRRLFSHLGVALDDYFSYTIHKITWIDDLKAHGWKINKKTKPYIAPELTDLINKNEYLHEIVNGRSNKMDRMDAKAYYISKSY